MRFFARATLLLAAAPSLSPCFLAEDYRPAETAAIVSDILPDAPEPRIGAASASLHRQNSLAVYSQIAPPAGEFQRQELQRPRAAELTSCFLSGTVTDANGDVVSNAMVILEGPQAADRQLVFSNDGGAFEFTNLQPGVAYRISIEGKGIGSWKSEPFTLGPGEYVLLKDIRLKIPDLVTSVTVYATTQQIATEQVRVQTRQRVFGFIPNFYVTYEATPVPLTTGLKFRLAFKADTDPMTFVGVGLLAGMYQAGDLPDYGQGMEGFGKRMGAGYADATSDIFLGGAVLPWLLHQDPRYFYQGTGTIRSRTLHALGSPFICRGDNGKRQPNYSSLLGDLSSGAISNLYYPESNRGAKLLFGGFLITTGVRTLNGVVQEFLLRKLTPSTRNGY